MPVSPRVKFVLDSYPEPQRKWKAFLTVDGGLSKLVFDALTKGVAPTTLASQMHFAPPLPCPLISHVRASLYEGRAYP